MSCREVTLRYFNSLIQYLHNISGARRHHLRQVRTAIERLPPSLPPSLPFCLQTKENECSSQDEGDNDATAAARLAREFDSFRRVRSFRENETVASDVHDMDHTGCFEGSASPGQENEGGGDEPRNDGLRAQRSNAVASVCGNENDAKVAKLVTLLAHGGGNEEFLKKTR